MLPREMMITLMVINSIWEGIGIRLLFLKAWEGTDRCKTRIRDNGGVSGDEDHLKIWSEIECYHGYVKKIIVAQGRVQRRYFIIVVVNNVVTEHVSN
jgi:hypothetical protein